MGQVRQERVLTPLRRCDSLIFAPRDRVWRTVATPPDAREQLKSENQQQRKMHTP
jgi:hypothetical protein